MGDLKWKFSTFYGLPGATTYQKLSQRSKDSLDTCSHPAPGGTPHFRPVCTKIGAHRDFD